MNGSGEESPDWLRSFQVPGQIALSSGSQSPIIDRSVSDDDDEDSINLSKLFKKETASVPEGKNSKDEEDSVLNKASEVNSPDKKEKVERTPGRKRKKGSQSEEVEKSTDRAFTKRRALEKPPAHNEPNHSVWMLSSDSESCGNDSSIKVEEVLDKELLVDGAKPTKGEENDDLASTKKSPKKQEKKEDQKKKKKLETQMKEEKDDKDVVEENLPDKDVVEENLPEKHNGPHVSSSRLPLLLPEKVQRTKALVECEGDSIDLSGDVGAVGRIVISDNPSGNHEMLFDLKGTIYKTAILPSRTFCVVSFGQSEAKVEAIMNDFIQLKPQSNVYEAETMVEGTLDGYSFDSDEEDNVPRAAAQGDQNENVEDQPNTNVKKPKAKKSSAMEQKKRKTGGKLPKKVKKKPQVSKKSKGKK